MCVPHRKTAHVLRPPLSIRALAVASHCPRRWRAGGLVAAACRPCCSLLPARRPPQPTLAANPVAGRCVTPARPPRCWGGAVTALPLAVPAAGRRATVARRRPRWLLSPSLAAAPPPVAVSAADCRPLVSCRRPRGQLQSYNRWPIRVGLWDSQWSAS